MTILTQNQLRQSLADAFSRSVEHAYKDLLDAAARDQRRSRTSIIEELVIESLKPRYSSTENRLNKLLGAG